MKITAVETIQLEEFPNLIWLHLHTDDGIVGLGESFFGTDMTAAYLHGTAAPLLIGRNPLEIDRISHTLRGHYLGFAGPGAEMRGASAVDIALWDIFGQSVGHPIHQMLGGLSRETIRIYNTCAGYRYVRSSKGQLTDNFGLASQAGPYEDLDAFLNRADELAHSLLEQGITAMKIWPFDYAAEATNGCYLGAENLARAIAPFEKIRRAVGNRMDVMLEMHSLWNLTGAKQVFRAVEPFDPFWFEDPVKMNNLDAVAELAQFTRVPITASETLATRFAFRELMAKKAAGVVMLDLAWCGGLSEAKKIATMAEAHHLPVAPHDCTGPVTLIASIHLSMNCPNALIQETVRAYYTGWYKELVTDLPRIERGHVHPMTKPGLGTRLLPDIGRRKDAVVRRTDTV
jgi:L-alanine-DL-glutamate epimerase-like enolase superfamily enzyme